VCVFSVKAVVNFVGKRGKYKRGTYFTCFQCGKILVNMYMQVYTCLNKYYNRTKIAGAVKNEKVVLMTKEITLHTSTSKKYHMQSSKVND